ncbi:MAG: methyl-accepting chemotaxis protein [Ruminococcaceae bacterium]|nr:methyl-accepting chemotaxis protein [Oscillospiraceae bacterium]
MGGNRMFKNMFKKLGSQITVITVAAVTLLAAVLMVVTISQFKAYSNGLLQERSNAGERVLETTLSDEITICCRDQIILTKDVATMSGPAVAIAGRFEEIYNQQFSSQKHLCVLLADENGKILYASPTTPFSSYDFSSVARGATISGVVKADEQLVGMYASAASTGSGNPCVIAVGFLMSETDWLDTAKAEAGCEFTIINQDTRYSTTLLNAQGQRNINTKIDSRIANVVLNDKTTYHGDTTINGDHYYVTYAPLSDVNGNVIGSYFAGSNSEAADRQFRNVALIAVAIGILGAVGIAVYLVLFTRRRVSEPLNNAELFAREMLAGQLDSTSVTYQFADDEVGEFVGVLKQAKGGMNAVVGDASRILAAMARGDFTERPRVDYPGVFREIHNNLDKIESDLGMTIQTMNASSADVLTGSTQMAEGSQSLAEGTTRQASAIEEISATIQDVSTQISATADNAAQAGRLSEQTQEKVNSQDAEIQNMVAAMNEISDTSKEIEKIIKTIEDIAFQTNILALNAAVEAARAGEAGKGFAVVADEVRNLATKSQEAAKSTSALINASIAAVGKGSEIATATAESMKEVKDMSAQTAKIIVDIAQASQEQSESIKQITAGVDQISQVIQTNAATAEETSALCSSLSGQSKNLQDQVARFKVSD